MSILPCNCRCCRSRRGHGQSVASITVQQRIADLLAIHGSYRAAAAAPGVSLCHLHDLGTGKHVNTTESTARKLGLSTVYYIIEAQL